MTYLVLGGSGFIGTEIVRKLLTLNFEVTIGDIREPTRELAHLWKFCDITDPFQVQRLVEGHKFVIHLAANPSPRLAEQNPRWDMRLNVEGTLNVAEACMLNNARMLFASTAAIRHTPLSCYSISKYTAELYLLNKASKGLDVVIARYNNVYGPTQPNGFVIPDLVEKLRENPDEIQLKGSGKEVRDFVYIDDVVDATMFVLKHGTRGEVYEVGTGRLTTIEELAKKIGLLMNGKEPKVTVEKQEETVVPPRQEIDKLFRLGWIPRVPLEVGLAEVIKARRNICRGATYVGPAEQRRESNG